ncbi:putative signal transducing protein [Kaistella sp.]|uniref:putative signal transducing protein n=1 Tax=Kaistella sp. TaxID=2782235 RepID=UPI00359F6EA4
MKRIMERETRVAVFESEKPAEIQLVKSKLEAQSITSFLNDNYMSFTTTPTANTVRVMVNLTDEQKAFEVIDKMLKETEFSPSNN